MVELQGVIQARAGVLQRLGQDAVNGQVEPLDFFRSEAGGAAKGIDAGGKENLVGVGVADAGHEGPTGEDPFDLAAKGAQRLAKGVGSEGGIKGLGAGVKAGDVVGIVAQVGLGHAGAVVQTEGGGVVQQPGDGVAGAERFPRGAAAQGAGEHQVEHDPALALEGDAHGFAAAAGG